MTPPPRLMMNNPDMLGRIRYLGLFPGERATSWEESDAIYVMWRPSKGLSKIGIAAAPRARLNQIRIEKGDHGIVIAASWRVLSSDHGTGVVDVEAHLHAVLRAAGLQDADNPFLSEWFAMPWPAAAAAVEMWAQLAAPLGVRLRQMPGVRE